jgi:hypothetical protein
MTQNTEGMAGINQMNQSRKNAKRFTNLSMAPIDER